MAAGRKPGFPWAMKRVAILADLGHFRAFRVADGPTGRRIIEDLRQFDEREAHARKHELASDREGSFRTGGSRDTHHQDQENEARLLQSLAVSVQEVLSATDHEDWVLAAPGHILKRLLDQVPEKLRLSLSESAAVDLTKASKEEIVRRFG